MTKPDYPRVIQQRDLPKRFFNALTRSGEVKISWLTVFKGRRQRSVPLLMAEDVESLLTDEKRLSRVRGLGETGKRAVRRLFEPE